MENPMRKDSATWYEMRCLKQGFGIEVAVHQSFFECWNGLELPKRSPEKPVWPIGVDTKAGWSAWKFKFPQDVLGKNREEAWQTRVLLQNLFDLINTAHAFNCHSSTRSCQLLFIEYFSVVRQSKGGGFSVVVCPSLGQWLSAQSEESLRRYSEEITKKMRSAGNHMARGQRWDWMAAIRRDRRILFTGGFSTVLCTSLSDLIKDSFGQRLTSDNIDGSYEQLVLLYAVAALHNLARQNGAK